MRRWTFGLIGVAVLTALLCVWAFRPSDHVRLQQARLALQRRDYQRAESLALAVARRPRSDPWAWMVAGEAALRAGRLEDALKYYAQVREGPAPLRASAAYGRGEVCLELGRLERAERELTAALEADPKFLPPRRRLVDLLNLSGRRHKATSWSEPLLLSPAVRLEDLFHAGDPDHALAQAEEVRGSIPDAGTDPLLILGVAFEFLAQNRAIEARDLFERVIQARPHDFDGWAGLGQSLLDTAPADLSRWVAQLPAGAAEDPAIMAVLGQIAEREGRHEDAARLYATVVAQRPSSRVAWHRFGQSLSRTGRAADADAALRRAQQLQRIAIWLDDLFEHRRNVGLIRRVAEQLAVLGRAPESIAWARYALSVAPDQEWAARLLARLQREPQALVETSHEAALADLLQRAEAEPALAATSHAPLRDSNERPGDTTEPMSQVGPLTSESRIRFADAAPSTGLDFVHHAARDEQSPGARIIETTGGGVAVLDYDGDGWPDLYFTQGSREFPMTRAARDRDRLFRNGRGERWIDVTDKAELNDEGFGQGVAAGDFNDDGFADLYVANYGVNRLYENLGDGTFREVTPQAMRGRPAWTSSCVLVDLNRDGFADLFDVTYCRGADVETRVCATQGVTRSCSPRAFQAEPDRLWLNTGDGGWELAADGGLDLPDGYGLGAVAFRPAPEAPLGLFIANDEVPNYWLINASGQPGGRPQWQDRAVLGGLAADANGQAQACMGVACEDADGDGLADLFVTNFYRESDTLYRAISSELFEDRTRPAGLRDPGWSMLGFGTQFVDADLDGWPDLLVANGHIDDLSSAGEPFQMPLQCFRNLGGVFRELTPEEAGECFARRALGRGLARLDWNRDGREDAVVVNQESPATLLTNTSGWTGRPLALQFRASSEARDAIGTIVKVRAGERVLTRQLTAGDGYQASNERQLVIGLAEAPRAEVEVYWPDGVRQEFGELATSAQYLLIQGRPNALHLNSY